MQRSSPRAARLPALVLALIALTGPHATVSAQQAAPDSSRRQGQQEPGAAAADLLARGGAFTASVEMVRVPVIVVSASGAFVQNLTRDDFAVHDGRRDHAVDHFISDAEPAVVGLLLDASVAMQPWGDDARIAVERIVGNLRADDELFLVSYGAEATMLQEPTADKAELVTAMDAYATRESDRVLYDAIGHGLSTLHASPIEKRSLIVIGAGGDTGSDLGELSIRQLISRAGVTIHVIAMSPRAAGATAGQPRPGRLQTLPEIAAFTAGFLARRPRLAARYGDAAGWSATAARDISNYLKHQYLLHYAPQDPPRPGTWRSIRVNVTGDHREIRARSGYTR